MRIELTPEQSGAINGERVTEVRDPATQREYVLMERADFDRLRGGDPRPEDVLKGLRPPFRLSSLPTPRSVAEHALRECKRRGLLWWFGGKKNLARMEREAKLRYYFVGKYLRTLEDGKDLVILAIFDGNEEEYQRQVAAISPEQKQRAGVHAPIAFGDEVDIIGGYFDNEVPSPSDGV